jgi:cytochrome c oxidase subunit 2
MDPQVRLHAGFQAVMPTYLGLMTPGQTAAILELIKSVREVPEQPGPAAAPAAEEGLPPSGTLQAPPPRLPIRVGPVETGAGGGHP